MDDPFAQWIEAPDDLPLQGDEVHVWGWHLTGSAEELRQLEATLSGDELVRMRAFRYVADAERFVWARGRLRDILGRYVDVRAHELRFVYGPHGKPALAGDRGGIHFNLSHTQSIAVAAFSKAGPVGIDVEERHTVSHELGSQVFSEHERRMLKTLSNELFTGSFFTGWTRKEAICKAEGLGFHLPMQAFSVSLLPGTEALIEDTGGVLSRAWRLVDLALQGATAGSLALDAASSLIRLYKRGSDDLSSIG